MFKLAQKKKAEEIAQNVGGSPNSQIVSPHIRLLTKEVPEMEKSLPPSCRINFPKVDELEHFEVTVCPSQGYWQGGKFVFIVDIPPDYNLKPPVCKCKTRVWHPNIDEEGKICLSILREPLASQTDGWTPARRLTEVIWAIDWLFDSQGLLNFTDPLNCDAARMYQANEQTFAQKVRKYIHLYAS